ncbi:unnamed protein product [Microthlaspi erraticum]|uniref:Uncharacterized protein n=1 Tax=Microthlaspi erraticum TaxID=1685480 RepID=A0A6D2L2W5_9BRAS|nr:unnamed protein product [Microthlaspi erraticum]
MAMRVIQDQITILVLEPPPYFLISKEKFSTKHDDAIMDEEVQAEEGDGMEQLEAEEGLDAAQLEPEESIAIPTGPITRSQTKALNQVISKVLSCLSQQETKPTTLVCLKALHEG